MIAVITDPTVAKKVQDSMVHSREPPSQRMGPWERHRLGISAPLDFLSVERGSRVRFMTAADLTTVLIKSNSVDRHSRKLDQLARYDLVILDELGYVPFDRAGADLLFTFVTRIYEQRSLIVTTNLPFPRWSEVFQDATAAAAVIDRVVHHSTILQTEGKSNRLETAEAVQLAADGSAAASS